MTIEENFLAEILEKRGIKLAEIARRANISKGYLNNFAKKRQGISDEVLIRLANILEVKPEEIIPSKSANNTKEGKKYLLKAIKMTDQYYADQGFDEDFMIDIATELYHFLISFDIEQDKNKNSLVNLKKDLDKKLRQGLAAKCFLDFLDKK
jgi:transcriptional regulator with XRE-family HTH domain